MGVALLQGSPRTVGEKTLVPVALIADFVLGSRFEFFWARPVAVREIGPHGERLMALLPVPGAERRLRMQTTDMLKGMAENLKSSASVDVVFGDTRETQGKAIIPVASVQYAFGAGGGEGTNPGQGEGQKAASGSGGGGSVKARPVAVLEVTPEDTRVLPVMDYTRLADVYAASIVSLNDHHASMAAEGFLNPRVFDILASGGFCISDANPALTKVFGDAIPQYSMATGLRDLVDFFVQQPEKRQPLMERGRRVTAAHTWLGVARRLLRGLEPAWDAGTHSRKTK